MYYLLEPHMYITSVYQVSNAVYVQMGTFAETAIVDYHLSIAHQGKQTSVFRSRLQKTSGSCRFH
jgi:hypothetical protein